MILKANERINRINENVTLIESCDGLLFTTDAYLLSAYVRRPQKKDVYAAELGAGTGVISLLIASRGTADRIRAFEVQERFCDIMQRNIEYNSLSEKIECRCEDIRNVSEVSEGVQFDIVFSNPPYMKLDSGKGNESSEKNIARREVMGGISDFCEAAKRLTKFGGSFYTVYRPERTAELFSSLRNSGFEPKSLTYVYPDIKSKASTVLCAAKRGGKPGLTVTPPLICYDLRDRTETDELRSIYENGYFPEEFTIK